MGQPCKDLGKLQMAEREASAKARRGAKLGGLGDRKKAAGTGEWGGGCELGVSW